jgi:AraC-like DNA-binding protein
LFLAGYSLSALSLLRKKEAKAYFWTEDLRTWLLRFTAGMLIISLIEAGLFVVEFSLPAQRISGIPFNLFHSFVLSAFVFWISVNAFKQYFPLQIFLTRPSEEDALISEEELSELRKALGSLMSRDHIYLNPDLNLELLANYLGISEKNCSYLLNTGMNENFNQYVNSFRVEAFRKRIQKGDHSDLTLTAIAYECGFNSKSTFNRVFKTSSGLTPSEYVKRST